MMIANEINNKFETGTLRICDGWEGIKSGIIKDGMKNGKVRVRAQSITLSINGDTQRNCAC